MSALVQVGGYRFEKPRVQQLNLSFDEFLERTARRGKHCLYLQHAVMRAGKPDAAGRPTIEPIPGLGGGMCADLSSLR